MKTEYEKMRSQELYYFSDPEIHASLVHAKKVCARLRSMTIYDEDYRQVIEELIPGIPQSTTICPPFHCDHGTGIILGENVFMNYDCIMLDGYPYRETYPDRSPLSVLYSSASHGLCGAP